MGKSNLLSSQTSDLELQEQASGLWRFSYARPELRSRPCRQKVDAVNCTLPVSQSHMTARQEDVASTLKVDRVFKHFDADLDGALNQAGL